ncbi:MAG: ABC transporter ATP-binding protein [Phycisphaerae bacterium]|jgi:lipopolysaccharide transport system ATP-binding protein
MKNDVVVKVEGISKKFCRSLNRSMWYGASDIIRDGLCIHNPVKLRKEEFWAVNDVSFELRRGEAMGIIGPNGSGKSTILKILNGIILPDTGKVSVRGRIGALISLGAGFHPQLTGRENIFINGAILGMSKREIDRNFDAIVDFSGLEEFLDMPVKHYSSGMFVRLAFSVAAHLDPDILLVDEVLAVGDVGFRAKSHGAIRQLRQKGASIILISHNLPAVYETCERTLVLWKGETRFEGETAQAINMFNKEMFSQMQIEHGTGTRIVNDPLLGEIEIRGGAEIKSVRLLEENGREAAIFRNGRRHVIETAVKFEKDVDNPVLGFFVWDTNGRIIHDTHTAQTGEPTGFFKAGRNYTINWSLTPYLLSNHYHIGISISHVGIEKYFYDRRVKALTLCVESDSQAQGIVDMQPKMEIIGD